MTRTAVDTDTFTGYTNGAFPSANWTNLNGVNGEFRYELSSGSIYVPFSHDSTMRRSSLGSYTADQYSKVAILLLSGSPSNDAYGVCVRASSDVNPTNDDYRCYLDDNSTGRVVYLSRIVNNAETVLATQTGTTWTAGDTISLEVTGVGATVTLNAYHNDVLMPSLTNVADTNAARLTAIGGPGTYGFGSAQTLRLDSWEGGNVTTGGSTTAQARRRRQRIAGTGPY